MNYRPLLFSALLAGTTLLAAGCAVAPPMNAQENQIKADLDVDRYMPATREMRDAIETQELFAQAAFWGNEYTLNPSDLESALKLASAVRRLGNPGRAVEITQHTRALYPRDPYLIAEYAAALIASERSSEALPILNQGLSTTSNYGRLWSLKGAALDQQERYAEARQNYDRALRITPNDPNVMANIGLSHALSGDLSTAEVWLRRAAAMPNASESVRQNLRLVLELQGKTDETQQMTAMARPQAAYPQMRPAFNPAPTPQQNASPSFQQQGVPQVRMQTGAANGQQFASASDAARAMASARAQQAAGQQAPSGYAQKPIQANVQTAPQPAAQGYPPVEYSQQYPGLAGAPAQAQPERRAPSRRRR